jgi:molybdopterin synthase catalytic subunit
VGSPGLGPFLLTDGPIDAEAVRLAVARDDAGAVVVFHGTVRDRTKGRRVLHLEYEAYAAMAVAMLREVADAVAREHGLSAVACTHRIGRLEVGDDAVVVGVSAPHRGAALAAVESFVARLKRDVPIWKKEHFEDGAVWVGSPDDPQGERAAGPERAPRVEGAARAAADRAGRPAR